MHALPVHGGKLPKNSLPQRKKSVNANRFHRHHRHRSVFDPTSRRLSTVGTKMTGAVL
jgi:hypothetical protein